MTVSPEFQSPIQIFIGEPLQHRSEYDCLKEVWKALAVSDSWAYIFANFHLLGRQIDFVVFTERTTVVIEAKGFSFPVRGGTNGLWEQLGPYGTRKIGNAYSQALNAKNALRDEIQRAHKIDGYPNGLVVVTPVIPAESRLDSDFKVVICGLNQTAHELAHPSGALLTQDQCESLAKRLGLEKVSSVNATLDEEVLLAERIHIAYSSSFRDFHEPVAAALISDTYTSAETEVELTEVHSLVMSASRGILIHGPSGCGKTMLATSCAVSCLDVGYTPIFVAGGNFSGNFQRLLDKEAALLGVRSANSVIKSARILGSRIILFLDGYNECPDDLKLTLTRSLKAFALRYDAGIVVSSQHELVRPTLLLTQTVTISRPSDALKARLAKIDQIDSTENLSALLEVANSGLEAALVGQVGGNVAVGSSRFGLFDTYARIKLGRAASEGIRVLCAIAEALLTRACFSLSVREFDRLCDAISLSPSARQHLVHAKLLHMRGDRISFVHELFFAAFAAEFAMRSASDDVASILATLESPRFFAAKTFVLGAIEDDHVLQRVLERIDDHNLLSACSRGECGAAAQSITKRKIANLLSAMVSEAQGLNFQMIGEGWHAVEVVQTSLDDELQKFGAYLGAIGDGLMKGQYLDAALSACRSVDNTIDNFATANANEAKGKKIPLRHDLFSAAYVTHRSAAISQLVNSVHSGGLAFRRHEGPGFCSAVRHAWHHADTPGQFYFLIGLTKFTACDHAAAPYVARLLRTIRKHPYHLQLGLIDFSQYLRHAEEPYRTEMIDALQASLNKLGVMMNSIIFEALDGLGALEDEAENYVPVVRDEIERALSTDSPESDQAAWGIFSCQFDHPFDSTYWDEIQALDEARKKQLLTMACRGANARYVSFVGILIRQLAAFSDLGVAPTILRWTALPDKASFMPQEAVEVFVNAHEALGRLGAALPAGPKKPVSDADHALSACGELFYWSNRTDLEDAETSTNTLAARSTLLQRCQRSAAGALLLTTSWMLSSDGSRNSLVKQYPELSAEICRRALERPVEQVSYFQHGFQSDPDSIACFAVQVLGEVGTPFDLPALRDHCDDKRYGLVCLDAIKKIEARGAGFTRSNLTQSSGDAER